jgi:galactose oxidase-like protein/Kelch motif protein
MKKSFVVIALAVMLSAVPGGFAQLASSTASASGAWVITGAMAAVHRGHEATLLNDGRVLISGAADSDDGQPSAEIYQPATRTWTLTANSTVPRGNHTATLLVDGRVLVAGGSQQGAGCFGCQLADVQLYDPILGTWSPAASMRVSRTGHTATRLQDGRVLVAGGDTSGFIAASSEIYDPATNAWTLAGSMSAQRTGHTATLLASGNVLVTGGYGEFDVGYSASAELFNPVAGTWSRTASMFEHRLYHAATLLTDGRVLVSGGSSPRDVTSAEIYDSASATWVLVGSMSEPRTVHTATRLSDGTVLVTGGNNRITGALRTAEIFDPMSSNWSTTVPMAADRANHSATLLTDGSVLVAGGCAFSPAWACAQIPTAELYIAQTDMTGPVITFTGNAGSYTIDQWITIGCSVGDAQSGVATSVCPSISAAAYTFGAGPHEINASATDVAGNTTLASTSFTVIATYESLCRLTRSFEDNPAIAGAMCKQLATGASAAARGNAAAKAGALYAFMNLVRGQSDRTLTTNESLILNGFAGVLLASDR